MLIYDDPTMLDWAAKRIHIERFRSDAKAIGWHQPLRGVVVYDNFSRCDCNMHVASDLSGRWLTRGFLAAVFAYPFIQCGLRRVTAMVPATNRHAIDFDRRLGFEFEGRCRDALPDDDILILGMRRTCCPFIPERYRHVRMRAADHPADHFLADPRDSAGAESVAPGDNRELFRR